MTVKELKEQVEEHFAHLPVYVIEHCLACGVTVREDEDVASIKEDDGTCSNCSADDVVQLVAVQVKP